MSICGLYDVSVMAALGHGLGGTHLSNMGDTQTMSIPRSFR